MQNIFTWFMGAALLVLVGGLSAVAAPNKLGSQTVSPSQLQQLPSNVQQKIKQYQQQGGEIGSASESTMADKNQEATGSESESTSGNDTQDSAAHEEGDDKPQKGKQSPSRALSKIEQIYNSNYIKGAGSGTQILRQFGYDLFDAYASQVSKKAVPDDGYILGPGDRLRVRIWGSGTDAEFTALVQADGSASLPHVGVIKLAGVTLGQVDALLENEFQKYIQGINLSVSMDKLRSIEVYVVGAVKNPGLHQVSAFATTMHALLAAQGVAKTGTMRSIKLLRDGEEEQELDLYHLLLQGQRQDRTSLQDRDVIFVPRIGPTAAVRGGVLQEGIFELKAEKNVAQLLKLSGGLLPQSFKGQLKLLRYANNQAVTVADFGARSGSEWRKKQVMAGDLLQVSLLGMDIEQLPVVRLQGHVWQPDFYKVEEGMQLSAILSSPDQLRPGAITDFGLIYRYQSQSAQYSVKRFPLRKLLQGQFDMELQPKDRVVVLSRQEKGVRQTVRIAGAVWQPGGYDYHPGMEISDLVSLAGGTRFGAIEKKVEVSRQVINNGKVQTRHIPLNRQQQDGFVLKPNDYVFVPMIKGAQSTATVELTGEVRFPGNYRIREGEDISDLIKRAGGFTEDAYFFGARYTSPQAQKIQQQSINQMIEELQLRASKQLAQKSQTAVDKETATMVQETRTNLQNFIDKLEEVGVSGRVAINLANLENFADSKYDFALEDGDALHIPQKPNFVAVTGAVYAPSAYHYQPGQTAQDYLQKAGGVSETADEDYMYILRANGEVISKKQGHMFAHAFASTEIMPGDTVVVPENLDRIPALRLVRDVSDILFKIATTAGIAVSAL